MKANIYTILINQFATQEGWSLNDSFQIVSSDNTFFVCDTDAIHHVVDSAIENPKSFHADALILIDMHSKEAILAIKKIVGLDKWVKLYAAVMAVPEFA